VGSYLVEDSMGYLLHWLDCQPRTFISQKVFINSFGKSWFPHKSVNVSLTITNKGSVDGFVLALTLAKRLYKHFMWNKHGHSSKRLRSASERAWGTPPLLGLFESIPWINSMLTVKDLNVHPILRVDDLPCRIERVMRSDLRKKGPRDDLAKSLK